ncbi:helix-turn-helix domain-containing protein [Weeksellaceae bacterium A-14]
MEAIILSKEQFDALMSKIDQIERKLNQKNLPKQEVFLDNDELIKMLKISRRTAQTWRDEGKISFSQVGNKIYYKLSDVEKTMDEYYNKSFSKKW